MGRPPLPYNESAPRSKRRKDFKRSQEITSEEAFAVASKKMRLDKNFNGSKLLKVITTKESADEIMSMIKKPVPAPMSAAEATAMIVYDNLTRENYRNIRKSALLLGHDLYPSYDKVLTFFSFFLVAD